MDIADWRKKIDDLDRKLVELLNERAKAAQQIGLLKNNTNIPIYEPDREKIIFENVCRANRGPLPDRDLMYVYEHVIDVMRKIQLQRITPEETKSEGPGQSKLERHEE